MIIDVIGNIEAYSSFLGSIADLPEQIRFLGNSPPGRYPCADGFALVQEGETTPADKGVFEAHRQYIDLQIMLDGAEILEWANLSDLKSYAPYSSEKDVAFYTGTGTSIAIKTGMFYIMFPNDAHKACCHIDVPLSYRKLVVKIPVKKSL